MCWSYRYDKFSFDITTAVEGRSASHPHELLVQVFDPTGDPLLVAEVIDVAFVPDPRLISTVAVMMSLHFSTAAVCSDLV